MGVKGVKEKRQTEREGGGEGRSVSGKQEWERDDKNTYMSKLRTTTP